MGRPPTPTATLKINGGYRKSRHGDRIAEPQPVGIPEPCVPLDGEALDEWNRVVPGLVETGVAKAVDSSELTAMCKWWAKFIKYEKGDDYREHNMAVASYKQFRTIAAKFGLSAGDRATLKIQDKQTQGVRRRQA